MAKKKKEIVPANKPLSPADLGKKVAKTSRSVTDPTIFFTKGGLDLIAGYAYKNDISIKAATYQISKKLYHLHKKNPQAEDLIRQLFPQGITTIERSLKEHKAIEQLLYQEGILVDADPDLSGLREEIKRKGLNKRSVEGKKKIAILERGGLPSVTRRTPSGSLVEDEKIVRPYKYKFSDQAAVQFKDVVLPSILETKAIKAPRSRAAKTAERANKQYFDSLKATPGAVQKSPTEVMQQELAAKKEIVPEASTRPEDIIKDLKAKKAEKDERVKNRTLEFLRKGGLKMGKKVLPFFGPIVAAVEAYQAGEATASEVERLIDAAGAGFEVAITPFEVTPLGDGELPERYRNDPEALRRAMGLPQQGENYELRTRVHHGNDEKTR